MGPNKPDPSMLRNSLTVPTFHTSLHSWISPIHFDQDPDPWTGSRNWLLTGPENRVQVNPKKQRSVPTYLGLSFRSVIIMDITSWGNWLEFRPIVHSWFKSEYANMFIQAWGQHYRLNTETLEMAIEHIYPRSTLLWDCRWNIEPLNLNTFHYPLKPMSFFLFFLVKIGAQELLMRVTLNQGSLGMLVLFSFKGQQPRWCVV